MIRLKRMKGRRRRSEVVQGLLICFLIETWENISLEGN